MTTKTNRTEHRITRMQSLTALFAPMAHRKPIHIDDPVAPAWLFRTTDRQLGIATWYGSAGWSVWYIDPDGTYDSIRIEAS